MEYGKRIVLSIIDSRCWYHVTYMVTMFIRKLSDNNTWLTTHLLLRQLIVNIIKWLETWSCRNSFPWPMLGVTFTSSFIDNDGGKGGWIPICTNGYSASPNSPRRAERASRGCRDRRPRTWKWAVIHGRTSLAILMAMLYTMQPL